MHQLNFRIEDGLWNILREHCDKTGERLEDVFSAALADFFDIKHHTIYQISTSVALVEGVIEGCVAVRDICRLGDFGLGTFDGFDGEGILLDGICWQACSDGSVNRAPDEIKAPFWVVTNFKATERRSINKVSSWGNLKAHLDKMCLSKNIFVAYRINGLFERVKFRSLAKTRSPMHLVTATDSQHELDLTNVYGTLVGFWSPQFARGIGINGYHFHFLSEDCKHGGYVLDLSAEKLDISLQIKNNLHLVLPETLPFLRANLNNDPTLVLAKSEGNN